MTLPILCIAALQISESSGPEAAEVCLPWFHRALKRAVEPLFSNRLAGDHENDEYFFHNRDAATPNFGVKLSAGWCPARRPSRLQHGQLHGVTPAAGRSCRASRWSRQPSRRFVSGS
jgi:hypothetical protein